MAAFFVMGWMLVADAWADGFVAKSEAGEIVTVDLRAYGTTFIRKLEGIELKLYGSDGALKLHDTFSPFKDVRVVKNEGEEHDDGSVSVRLVVQGKNTRIALSFDGEKSAVPDPALEQADWREVDLLVQLLGKKSLSGQGKSKLTICCREGAFVFRDIVFSTYGDV